MTPRHPVSRRDFFAVLPAGAALGAVLTAKGRRLGPRLDRWGVQLYTVRTLMEQRPGETLAALAEIGYREVELAGLYGMSPLRMRARLDEVGLAAVSSHESLATVRDRWDEALASAAVLGQRYVVVPSIPGAERAPERLRAVADDFNMAGERARSAGLRFGYHNHDWEFRPGPDGVLPIDLLLERCDPEIVHLQLDIFWAVHGGVDPLTYVRRTPGRVTTVHVKDRTSNGEMVDVGDGVIDFATVLAEAERLGLEHAFVEHDRPVDAIASVRRSFRQLQGER